MIPSKTSQLLHVAICMLVAICSLSCSKTTPTQSKGSAAESSQAPKVPNDLYFSGDTNQILSAARTVMESDANVALATVDENGQPRVRTVRAFLTDNDPADPKKGMTVWIMTRETTRKVAQIKHNSRVTL
jgi:pyridoxine/pyridoxamine 5'-phosphate oxidase